MPSNHLIICCLLLLPSVFPSIRVFSIESALCIRCQSIGASASVLPVNIQVDKTGRKGKQSRRRIQNHKAEKVSCLSKGRKQLKHSPTPKRRNRLYDRLFLCTYCHRFRDLRINYVAQLSAFQPPHQLKASHDGFLPFKERTFFNSENTFSNNSI